MSYIIYSVLMLLNGLFGFWKKHSKFIALAMMIFIWILFFGNTDNPDLLNYINQYENVLNMDIVKGLNSEQGYYVLTKIFASLGFSYHFFVAIVSLICYIMIFSTIKKYTINYNYVVLFYSMHLFIFDIIQFRNFIAMSIMIFSIRYIVENTKKARIKYFISICIASTIHKTAIVFLILLLIKVENKNRLIKFISIFSIIGSLFVYINGGEIPFISQYIKRIVDGSVQATYLEVKVPLRYIISLFLLQIINFATIFICKLKIEKNYNKKIVKYEERIKFVDVVFWANCLAFLFFPLYMESINFYRLMRNFNILNFTVMSITSDCYSIKDINKILFNIIMLINILAWFTYDLGLSFSHFIRIFENNLFFG